ncbi:MAG: hypothetical protein J6W44_05345 [Oscillospiraceae bacterium]|nr:hypothetical protein [Oscillospiraceae bacterium]
MNKFSFRALLLCLVLLFSAFGLSACGREKSPSKDEGETTSSGVKIREVKISGSNFYDYFEYKEYPKYQTDEDGVINACELSYGFSLREGYVAANDPDHKDTLKVSFTADEVSQNGEFDINFQNLTWSGNVFSEEHTPVSETLTFWPQGNKTLSYPAGLISTTYIIRLEAFTVTSVEGSIYLIVR